MELQCRDAREVAHIARQLDELVVNRSCRDQQVKIGYGYELALATKAGADASKALHDGIIECRQREAGEEPAKTSELGRGTRGANSTFFEKLQDLGRGDRAYRPIRTPSATGHSL